MLSLWLRLMLGSLRTAGTGRIGWTSSNDRLTRSLVGGKERLDRQLGDRHIRRVAERRAGGEEAQAIDLQRDEHAVRRRRVRPGIGGQLRVELVEVALVG